MSTLAISAVAMFVVGLLLSALFSGSETGFYRATRVRLVLDALGGSYRARGILALINRPMLFIATTLIGNNLANYMTSLSIVLGVQLILVDGSAIAELLTPIALAPFLFIYGELLPKNLFYYAPNRLLRMTAPLFLLSAVILLPLSAIVWGLNKLMQSLLGQSPQQIQLTLARKELQQVLEEGHEVGILRPAQRQLAHGLFSMADRKVAGTTLPVGRVATIRKGTTKADALRLAHRRSVSTMLVESPGRERALLGYVRVVDLYLGDIETIEHVRPLVEISNTASHLVAMMQLETADESMAQVVDDDGKVVGILTTGQLLEPLLRGD